VTLYLFWDIDGTLLLTARAGVFALEEASEAVLGRRADLGGMLTAGMTDFEIAAEVCAGLGVDDPAAPAAFLAAYERLLPERLAWRQGRVLPNVRENLDALSGRDDVINMLLTGNVAGGAEAKLRHYGLWDYFGAGGAFSVEGCDRPAIARRARELAAGHGGEVPPGDRMVVIGDTPHDIRCGQAIGARTLAVATGPSYGMEALEACGPWAAVEALPAPPGLERLLGLDGRRTA
jgi:phosphoglycolate phosphatase-like HAD superfamily hydrolase